MEGDWLLAVHSGAGRYGASNEAAYLSLLRSALESTHRAIASASSPPTAVEMAAHLLQSFELSSLTNAGLGANLTEQGRVECEASVVCGETRSVSCCGAVRGVRRPSALALRLLQQATQVEDGAANATFAFGRQPPLVVVGEHARQLARDFGLETATDDGDAKLDEYQVTDRAQQHWDKWRRRFRGAETEDEEDEERLDTVGAICMDPRGNVAAALSSGGVAFKVPGRLGLAGCPRMGCDAANAVGWRGDSGRKRKRTSRGKNKAKNAFAVACTGRGEQFVRSNLVGALARRLAKSSDVERALRKVVVESTAANGGRGIEGGVLALVAPPPCTTQRRADGVNVRSVELGVAFTTPCMGVGFLHSRADAEPQVQVELLRRPETSQTQGHGQKQLAIHVSFFRLPVHSQGK